MSDAPRSPRHRLPPRRLAAVVGAWVVLAGGALVLAGALDSPVGAGGRDAARPATPGPVATPDAGVGDLPPLAMVLDRPLPADIAALAPIRQLDALRVRAMTTRSAARFVELGSLLQLFSDNASAEASFRAALRFDPGSVGAQVGLALVDGASGPEGLIAGARRLQELAAANPESQLVSFNQGWLEIYRRRARPAAQAWRRTIALGPRTKLGRTATELLATLESGSGGRNP